jgi:hypothetical protein
MHKPDTQFNISSGSDGPILESPLPLRPMPSPPEQTGKGQSGRGIRAFLTGAIVAGSALLGGLAVVLWNRKALSGLRQPATLRKKSPAHPDGEDE